MKYGSRKFILALVTIILSSLLVYVGSLTAVVYGGIIGTVFAVYAASNVTQKGVLNGTQSD